MCALRASAEDDNSQSALSEGLSLTAHSKSSFTGSWMELSSWNKDGALGALAGLLDYSVSLFPHRAPATSASLQTNLL